MLIQGEKAIHIGKILSYFELPETNGDKITTWDFHGRRNLLIIYISDPDRDQSRDLLKQSDLVYDKIQEEETELITIVQAPLAQAKTLKQDTGLHGYFLVDENGTVFQRFGLTKKGGEQSPIIIITDRFGEVYFENLSNRREIPTTKEILDWLKFIESQCPE